MSWDILFMMDQRNLIFLISQPRSGSTLLQSILGTLPDVHTVSEPWLMLPQLYPLCSHRKELDDYEMVYQRAMGNFISELLGGRTKYLQHLREKNLELYGSALKISNKKFFLDKTPRYYLILSELYEVFPEAKYILLFRNPLAVLHSVWRMWHQGNIYGMFHQKDALLDAPQLLVNAAKYMGDSAYVISYEDLLENPEQQLQLLCEHIGVPYYKEALDYNNNNWLMGDKEVLNKHSTIFSGNSSAWIQSLADPQFWGMANDYLNILDAALLEKMGYSYDELQNVINENKPQAKSCKKVERLPFLLSEKRVLNQMKQHRQEGFSLPYRLGWHLIAPFRLLRQRVKKILGLNDNRDIP